MTSTDTTHGIHPFRIDFPHSDLDDLHQRFDRTRWPDELPGVGWAYGIPRDYLRELVRYWRHAYDWRAAEARLNEWPRFTTEIDGVRIHFAHIRSPEPDATPLLITHGRPGWIVEFTDVVGPLTDPRARGGDPSDAFHLVVPTMPGFGLSGPTRDTGWEFTRVAAAFAALMDRPGHLRYGVQGGDWGGAVSRELGRAHPERVIGVPLNLLPRRWRSRICRSRMCGPSSGGFAPPAEGTSRGVIFTAREASRTVMIHAVREKSVLQRTAPRVKGPASP
jgi:hypothetical protein